MEAIHTLRLHIVGKVIGRGRLDWNEGRKTEEVSGDVNLDWSNEWYSTESEIGYTPIGMGSRELRIYYKFEPI